MPSTCIHSYAPDGRSCGAWLEAVLCIHRSLATGGTQVSNLPPNTQKGERFDIESSSTSSCTQPSRRSIEGEAGRGGEGTPLEAGACLRSLPKSQYSCFLFIFKCLSLNYYSLYFIFSQTISPIQFPFTF
jgi:hypothetical protein